MPQSILKERKAHLASYLLLQGMLINIKTYHFHSYEPPITPFLHNITSYFRPVNIAKFLRTVLVLLNSHFVITYQYFFSS